MLASHFSQFYPEAGCDEAGRGCLAGSVYAAAVILPQNYHNEGLNDSKKLTPRKRYALREEIQRDALAWAVGIVTPQEIDSINILKASILAMHRALDQHSLHPRFIIVDGNKFYPYGQTLYQTIVKGDGKYESIAAASILAKTYRDDYMQQLHKEYPFYGWDHNAGYATALHREGIRRHGCSPYPRRSYRLLPEDEPTLF